MEFPTGTHGPLHVRPTRPKDLIPPPETFDCDDSTKSSPHEDTHGSSPPGDTVGKEKKGANPDAKGPVKRSKRCPAWNIFVWDEEKQRAFCQHCPYSIVYRGP